MNLKAEIGKIKSDLIDILGVLDRFDSIESGEKINKLASSVLQRRELLIKNFPLEKLKEFNSYFATALEQIDKKIINLIDQKKSDAAEVAIELKKILNQKKAAQYK